MIVAATPRALHSRFQYTSSTVWTAFDELARSQWAASPKCLVVLPQRISDWGVLIMHRLLGRISCAPLNDDLGDRSLSATIEAAMLQYASIRLRYVSGGDSWH